MLDSISVIVCTYNRQDCIRACIESVVDSILHSQEPHKYELIVVNNNSTDNTGQILESMSVPNCVEFSIVGEYKQGLSFARNKGIEVSKYDYVTFIDDDAFVRIDWCKNLSSYIKDNSPSAFGGKIIPIFESEPPKWFRSEYHSNYSILDCELNSGPFPPLMGPVGANMGFYKKAFTDQFFITDLGRKGESLLSGEESEFFARIRNRSMIHYIDSVVVKHLIPDSRLTKNWLYKRFYYGGYSHIMTKSNLFKQVAIVFIFIFRCIKMLPKGDIVLLKSFGYMVLGAIHAIFKKQADFK